MRKKKALAALRSTRIGLEALLELIYDDDVSRWVLEQSVIAMLDDLEGSDPYDR